ncbi:hypothetical protein HMPREF9374_2525 [Desmospora sp. 8437]|nr:hypothetical protein HMPREF9374_2525 [Desmospora sp. 8437]
MKRAACRNTETSKSPSRICGDDDGPLPVGDFRSLANPECTG